METIKLRINELLPTFNALMDLMDTNPQPFLGQAKNLIYDLQRDINYIREKDLTGEDFKAISQREIDFGERIVAPQSYPQDYIPLLKKVCKPFTEKRSRIELLLQEQKAKVEDPELEVQAEKPTPKKAPPKAKKKQK